MPLTFEIYEDTMGKYRWRLVQDDGYIVADGGEGYSTRQKARQRIEAIKEGASDAEVAELVQ